MDKNAQDYLNRKIYKGTNNDANPILLTEDNHTLIRNINPNVSQASISGDIYYIKTFRGIRNIGSIITSEMYNSIGVPTPIVQLGKIPGQEGFKSLKTICKAVQGLPGYEAIQAITLFRAISSDFDHLRKKWDLLSDINFRMRLMKYMTPECFDAFVGLFLVDELRTETDRHPWNYFLIRKPGEKKFSGIVPIDHDLMLILEARQRGKIENIIYNSYTPQFTTDLEPYHKRVSAILNLIHQGKISQKNVNLIRSALNYDLPSTTSKLFDSSRELQPYRGKICPEIEHLWEYNRKEFKYEIGL